MKSLIDKLTGENGPIVGLDVGQNSIKAIKFENPKGRPVQVQAFRLSREEEGILDEADLFSHLPEWLTAAGVRGMETVIGIPQHVTTVQITSFPRQSAKALDGMVAFQTRQLADLSDDNFVHDYCVMDSTDKEQLPVVIGVCLEALIQERCEKYAGAGIRVADFGISSLAMASAFRELKPELAADDKVHLLLDIGTESTTMVAVRNGRIHFCGTLDFGGDRYAAAMAEKEKKGGKDEKPGLPRSVRRTHIRTHDRDSALGQVAQMLVAEIRSGIEYWQEQHEDDEMAAAEPDGLFLCGGGALLPGLLDFLERSLECDVALLRVPGLGESGDGIEFVTAYGLALQAAGCSPLSLSLAPESLKWHAKREKRSNLLIVVAVCLLLALSSLFYYEWWNLGNKNDLLDVKLRELGKCEKIIKELEDAGEILQALETVQLPVLEHGNRARRFAHALEIVARLKGNQDWFVYFGDRQAFDEGKDGHLPVPNSRSPKTPINPFAAPVYETKTVDGNVVGPMYPVAGETEPLHELVAAGYTLLVENEPYLSVRQMNEKLNTDPFFKGVDVLAASEAVGRDDIFSEWNDYIERERQFRRLPHELRRFTLKLSFAETDITDAPKTENK